MASGARFYLDDITDELKLDCHKGTLFKLVEDSEGGFRLAEYSGWIWIDSEHTWGEQNYSHGNKFLYSVSPRPLTAFNNTVWAYSPREECIDEAVKKDVVDVLIEHERDVAEKYRAQMIDHEAKVKMLKILKNKLAQEEV